ncbi:MarR family winged helix-turn-helix transcriptional regulator [Streptomyces sp. NPDC088847]|uniref:MarR family winged helix-turn-helix transcriptional regulator n=1 Tax=Streptomyces sp. NPDC088847 TaxID=3365909 RepID=UPI00380B0EAD
MTSQRPDTEVSLATLFSDLIRVETRLYNALDDRLKTELDSSLGRYEILDCVAAREKCRVHDVANTIAITVGAASKAVDRIEAAGLCVRTTDPGDRRSSHLTLTPAGEQLLARARVVFEDEMRRRVAGVLSADALYRLGAALAPLRRSLEADGTTGGTGRQVR